MKWYHFIAAAIMVAVLLYRPYGKSTERSVFSDTIIYYDTIRVEVPVPRDSVVIRYIAEKLPVHDEKEAYVHDCQDSVTVTVPVVQKVYSNDLYRAYVSGYRPSLDSLYIYTPVKEITTRCKPKRWGIGPYVGVDALGMGVSFGVSLQYSLVRF